MMANKWHFGLTWTTSVGWETLLNNYGSYRWKPIYIIRKRIDYNKTDFLKTIYCSHFVVFSKIYKKGDFYQPNTASFGWICLSEFLFLGIKISGIDYVVIGQI